MQVLVNLIIAQPVLWNVIACNYECRETDHIDENGNGKVAVQLVGVFVLSKCGTYQKVDLPNKQNDELNPHIPMGRVRLVSVIIDFIINDWVIHRLHDEEDGLDHGERSQDLSSIVSESLYEN